MAGNTGVPKHASNNKVVPALEKYFKAGFPQGAL
jgi:acyl-CoA reductase-like NAD-dependent aldehyde dehydrogenase